jgi:RNA polymerase sigma-70 factor (ECF subfamily)
VEEGENRVSQHDESDPVKLLARVRDGEAAALGQLLDLYHSYLGVLARVQIGRRLQAKVDTDDVIQDTYLQAYRNFAQFRGTSEEEFLAWLRQILASRLVKLVRRYYGTQRRDVRLERELEEALGESSRVMGEELSAPQSTPSQRAARREQAVLLADALSRLPEDYREAIILRHVEGLAFPEVARRMDRTPDSVKKLWTRGLAQLRRLLGEQP